MLVVIVPSAEESVIWRTFDPESLGMVPGTVLARQVGYSGLMSSVSYLRLLQGPNSTELGFGVVTFGDYTGRVFLLFADPFFQT